MIHDKRLIDAIRVSGIKRVLLLDDAFDLPKLEPADYAKFYEVLEGDASDAVLGELSITDDLRATAMEQIKTQSYNDDELGEILRALHRGYLLTRQVKYDPTGVFSERLSNNLADVDPLLTLLRRCKELELTLVGVDTPLNDLGGKLPDLVFADFYLHEGVTAEVKPDDATGKAAKAASIKRLEEILALTGGDKNHPSVVLMSSKDVRTEADDYRREASDGKGRVFASRFGFMLKSEVKLGELPQGAPMGKPAPITVDRPAADVLLDIIQSHPFGQELHRALLFYLESSSKAVTELRKEIEELQLKDFAYLVTYRLAQEGLSLFDYLEWFFGECLLAQVSALAANKIERPTREDLDKHANLLEGAYDGRTAKIAELYDRARVDGTRDVNVEMRMGDLYVERDVTDFPAMIGAVISAGCDLIERDGRRAAERLLTVGGRLIPYDAPKSSLADFIIIGKALFSIDWQLKNLVTRETMDGLEFHGTLRPLYAQDLQRRALNDLGRMDLPVAPVVRMDGRMSVKVVGSDGKLRDVPLGDADMCKCEVYPNRGGSDSTRITLHRPVAENLVSTLAGLDPQTLNEEGAKWSKALKGKQDTLRAALCKGAELEKELTCCVLPTEKMSVTKGWCGICVEMAGDVEPSPEAVGVTAPQ